MNLPEGVTYDGTMAHVSMFTDRAVTRSTFAVVTAELSIERIELELAKMRAKFSTASNGEPPKTTGAGSFMVRGDTASAMPRCISL